MGNHTGNSPFPTTQWTLVLAAGAGESSLERSVALEDLCRRYWFPVYAFVRHRGHPAENAQDLTQSFFLGLLDGAFFERADPGKGRFRSFLLGAVQNFLCDEQDRARSQKRGGGVAALSFDFSTGELNYAREPRNDDSPEQIFNRNWAHSLLGCVMGNLEDEFRAEHKLTLFQCLKSYLVGEGDLTYAELAQRLNLTESGLKSAIRRARLRYRDLLRAEVGATVADPSQVDEELRFLIRTLSVQEHGALASGRGIS